ncbi:MAG: beta-phosphoglucomutase [Anaerolineae bacterium]|nr:beta-phosphoglucomutase [Anaerolineae bacterium]MDW8171666.1 beta-phosphoglucomutase [Anaerolineae bacterium]
MSHIRAFIFDLDGVITDTAEYHYLAWKRLADEEGLPFSRQDNDALRGVSRRESLLRLLKGRTLPEADMQAWMERKNAYYLDYLQGIGPDDVLHGVRDFLARCRAYNLRLGIGSASKNARLVVERLGLIEAFDVIGDGYSVVHSKPAPDLFIWVAGALRVPVQEAVVFEDAPAGVDAALAAGCWCVGLGTAQVQHAHLCYPSLAEVNLPELLSAVQAQLSRAG